MFRYKDKKIFIVERFKLNYFELFFIVERFKHYTMFVFIQVLKSYHNLIAHGPCFDFIAIPVDKRKVKSK
mgnify:CR=1